MINNIIIALSGILVLFQYYKKKYISCFCVIGIAYVCLPIVRYGSNGGINSAYVVTLLCFIIFIHSYVKKELVFHKRELFYLIFMLLGQVIMFLGWVLNGNPNLGGIIHFFGAVQYIGGVFMLSLLISSYKINKKLLMRKIISLILFLNYIIVFIQVFSWKWGEIITRKLYVYNGKEAPINVMRDEAGRRFARAFGTFYSPTLLGVVSLLCFTFFLYELVCAKRIKKIDILYYVASLGLGLLAFSKTVIIGVFLIWGLALLSSILRTKNVRVGKYFKALGIACMVFVVVGMFQCAIGLGSQVNYYYFKASNITVALKSRYNNLSREEKETITDEVSSQDKAIANSQGNANVETGNLNNTYNAFRKHPVIGVGPEALDNEFVGDSEYITVLHNGGGLMFLIYAVFYGGLLVFCFYKKQLSEMIVLIAIGFSGVSMTVFSYSCSIPFLAYCISSRIIVEEWRGEV